MISTDVSQLKAPGSELCAVRVCGLKCASTVMQVWGDSWVWLLV